MCKGTRNFGTRTDLDHRNLETPLFKVSNNEFCGFFFFYDSTDNNQVDVLGISFKQFDGKFRLLEALE